MAPPALAVPAGPKSYPRSVAGLQCRPLQAKDSGFRKNSIALSKFHRRGEHCSPAKALRYHKAPRVEQSPTPTINRERVLINFSVISQFCRRGGAWLRPPLPRLHPKKIPPHRCGPAMQAPTSKRQGLRKISIALSKFHRRGEHCSPVKALCCHKVPRVEQSPTPTICRERVRLNFIAISQFCRRGGAWLRPPLPQLQTSKYPPAPLRACNAGPYKQ